MPSALVARRRSVVTAIPAASCSPGIRLIRSAAPVAKLTSVVISGSLTELVETTKASTPASPVTATSAAPSAATTPSSTPSNPWRE